MKLKDKVILITGAGGLIGSTIAKKLADEGAILILVDIDKEFLNNIESVFNDRGFVHASYQVDITDSNQIESLFNNISTQFGRLDVLINNAGIQAPIGKFIDNDITAWFINIKVNLLAVVEMTHHALKFITKSQSGKIINIAGGGSTSSRPNLSAYAVAKTGVVRFTEVLADELRELKIFVNAVSPGAVNSRMLDEILDSSIKTSDEYQDALKRKQKGGTDPSFAAELVCFLASDDSYGITGKVISAPWDHWKDKEFQEKLKKDKDFATLRRIDEKIFYKKS